MDKKDIFTAKADKKFTRISDDPRIEVLHVSSFARKKVPYSFRASWIDHVEEVASGNASSAIFLKSGVCIRLSLPYAALVEKLDEEQSPLDLKAYCTAPPPPPPVGERVEDGSIYLGFFENKDWFVAAEDARNGADECLRMTFNRAADYARSLRAHDHADWAVPKIETLEIMCAARDTGSFQGTYANGWYWSSTTQNSNGAQKHISNNGSKGFYNFSDTVAVRCVRSQPRLD